MPNPTRSLLAALVSTMVVVTAALVWAGWRLLDQQRAIDEQRARGQAESAADAVVVGIRAGEIKVTPDGGLPFVPIDLEKRGLVAFLRSLSGEVSR